MRFGVNIITYNGVSAFIEKTIESVLPYADEVIVFDTGSTDNTVEVLKKYPIYVATKNVQSLGKVWTDSPIDVALTNILNEMKKQTKSGWILKIDDDEIFPQEVMEEIKNLEPTFPIYSIPFLHVGKDIKLRLIKRLFQNIPEVSWVGRYGNETLAYNNHKYNSTKCPALKNFFIHLGELRKDDEHRKHDYKYSGSE